MNDSADRQWVRVRTRDSEEDEETGEAQYTPSIHVLKTFTRAIGGALTLCGRTADGNTVTDNQPAGKTCETCLAIVVS